MADYGRALEFGIFLTPDATKIAHTVDIAEQADRRGLDLLGIQDHPYHRGQLDSLDFTDRGAHAHERHPGFPDVANLPLREPALLAKAAASLDQLTGGRVELGLGAGVFWEAIGAMNGPVRSPREAAQALIEAIAVIRAMWSGKRTVHISGEHYRLSGAHPGPMPAHPIGLWLGVLGPRLLEATGRYADGWVPSSSYLSPEKLPAKQRIIDDAARSVGRDPVEIRRVYNLFGSITPGPSRGFLNGPVEQWIDELTQLALEGGVDTFILGNEGDNAQQFGIFAEEIAPAVRSTVADERR